MWNLATDTGFIKKMAHDSEGSLTLEATIVFPVFLALLLALINLVNISLTYIAMDHAVRETVKQIAVQSYLLKKVSGETTNLAVNALTKAAITAKIKESNPLANVGVSDMEIKLLNMYNPDGTTDDSKSADKPWDNKDIAVKVEYKIRPMVPFLPLKEIVLSNTAVERAWADE